MFGHRYFGAAFYGPEYFGPGTGAIVVVVPPEQYGGRRRRHLSMAEIEARQRAAERELEDTFLRIARGEPADLEEQAHMAVLLLWP